MTCCGWLVMLLGWASTTSWVASTAALAMPAAGWNAGQALMYGLGRVALRPAGATPGGASRTCRAQAWPGRETRPRLGR